MKQPIKSRLLVCLIVSSYSLLQVSILHAQEQPETGQAEVEAAEDNPVSPEYLKLITESASFFEQENYEQALERLDKADAIRMETSIALNLRGAIATESGEFDLARSLFVKALEKDEEYFAPRFNLGEILFLEKQYNEARAHFQGMLQDMPDNELLQFKIFLTYLLQDKMEEAKQALAQIKFPSDTPSYYFANAALDFYNKKEEEARSWIDSSKRIFGEQSNHFYMRSMADIGFISKEEIIKSGQDNAVDRTPVTNPTGSAAPEVRAASGVNAPDGSN